MSLRLICPNGHELIVEAAYIGRKVRCPACKVVMLVPDPHAGAAAPPPPRPPAPPPPLPPTGVQQPQPPGRRAAEPPLEQREEVIVEEIGYDEERPRKKGMKTRQRMRLVNIGLALHYAELLCIIVALLLYLLMLVILPVIGVAGAAGSVEGVGAGIGILQVVGCLAALLLVATPILGGTGSLLCFWVPEKARARVLVIVSFGLEVGGVALMVLGYVLALGTAASGAFEAAASLGLVPLLGGLVGLAGFILFMLFLRALALYLRDEMSADEAMRQLVMFLAVGLGGGVVVSVLMYVLIRTGRVGLVLMMGVWIGWLVALTFVFFAILNVIGTIRAKINSRWG
jgi:hypothetical protein